jgi:outer membrane protein assembly factor BamB
MRPSKKLFAGGVLFLLCVLCSALFMTTMGQNSARAASDDWTGYLNGSQNGYNAAETALNSSNVSTLALKWSHTSGAVSAQPVVSNGVVYWGSWDGLEHAYTTSGTRLWETQLGQTSDGACSPSYIGVASTAAVGTAGSTSAIFVGGGGNVSADGRDNLVALNATTGAVIWKTDIGTSPAPSSYQFGSPVYSNGSVYIGIASLCDNPLVQGQVVKVSASTGQIQATFNVVPNGCNGGGVWSTPIITGDGKVYFSTGNPGNCNEPYATAVVELNASDLSLVGYSQVNTGSGDWDFASVTPFSANGTNYVGAINKNGNFYAFRQNNLSSGVAWQTSVGPMNECPQCAGNIAPAAFDGSRLYVASGSANGCAGTVDALNPANGSFEWRHCLSAPDLGAVTAFPGVVVVGAGSQISAVSSSTGASLYTYYGSGTFWGPPSVAEGMLFEGNQNGQLLAFAPGSGGTTPTPTPTSGGGSVLRAVASNRCLDVPGAATANSTLLNIWDCNGGANQKWASLSNGELQVYGNKCLDVPGFSTTPGTRVEIYDCNDGTNQQWTLNSNGTVVGRGSGLCLDVVAKGTANGTAVDIWTCNGGSNQNWARS